MNIQFPSVDETYIKQQVDAGFYSNATELVRDAVRRLREEHERRTTLRAAVQTGEGRGGHNPYTPERFEEIKKNARAKATRGHQAHPDVLP